MGACLSFLCESKVGSSVEDECEFRSDVKSITTGLTTAEEKLVKQTWEKLRPNHKQHGIEFFLMLFETYPLLQSRFKPFVNKRLEELKCNKRLAAHGTTVMTALDSYILNLDDVSCLVEILKTTAGNHKMRGVKKSDLEQFVQVLLQFISSREALASIWNDTVEKAWNNLFIVILSVMFQGFDEREQ